MSGHSKWSTIKRKKGAADSARGKLFSKLTKEITIAARDGGGDIETNARLKLAVEKAKAGNMPNDNIARAINRGTGDMEGVNYEEMIYEGYGPGGIAFYLEITTDNKNRTAAEIRSLFSKNNGNLGSSGCVAYMFEKKGIIHFDPGADEDTIMEIALEAGADDVESDSTGIDVTTPPDMLHVVCDAFKKKEMEWESADLTMIPSNSIMITGKTAEQVLKLMDLFEDHDDVANVYANFDIDEAELLAMG
ncbi:YebC/PmpR family DNA-binding transcriptional regulator [bacterium]|nr:YebC/PmpR family DNA-binding transcriptional regulator [bacterium]